MHLGKRPPHHSEPALLREQRATDVFTDTGQGSTHNLERGVVAAQKTNDLASSSARQKTLPASSTLGGG